jgi:hypothetical protein
LAPGGEVLPLRGGVLELRGHRAKATGARSTGFSSYDAGMQVLLLAEPR